VAKRNKSALKANRQNVKRRESNRQLRSKLRTGLKAVRKAADGTDRAAAKTAVGEAQSLVDKMAAKGIIHKNTAARYKSRLVARASKYISDAHEQTACASPPYKST
jgi:small subunit ribosomal protein S20